jgi:hypothetical protein
MVVYHFHIVCVAADPAKTDPPPVIDPEAVLALSATLQFLQAIIRRNAQILKSLSGIKDQEFTDRNFVQFRGKC